MASRSFFESLAPRPPKPPVASASRAGRNLYAAVPVAIGLLALVALSVMWRIELFVALVAVALILGMWEACGAYLAKHIELPFIPLAVSAAAMVGVTWWAGITAGFLSFVFLACLVAAYLAVAGGTQRVATAPSAIFVLAWIGLLGSFAVALAKLPNPAACVALLILMPAASDTGGWLFGVLWGKHPMSPSISPKKSWEGFAGSLVLSLAAAAALGLGALDLPLWLCAVIGVCATACATVGDLSESLIKRDLGVKDMGTIFPGHGGVLDRVDSTLMWAPVCYAILATGM